jgi:hypothetical protein
VPSDSQEMTMLGLGVGALIVAILVASLVILLR